MNECNETDPTLELNYDSSSFAGKSYCFYSETTLEIQSSFDETDFLRDLSTEGDILDCFKR